MCQLICYICHVSHTNGQLRTNFSLNKCHIVKDLSSFCNRICCFVNEDITIPVSMCVVCIGVAGIHPEAFVDVQSIWLVSTAVRTPTSYHEQVRPNEPVVYIIHLAFH